MALRYIFRKKQPEDLEDIRSFVTDLDTQLGPPAAKMHRQITHSFDHFQQVSFDFLSEKVEDGFKWICSSIELAAETEKDFLALKGRFDTGALPTLTRTSRQTSREPNSRTKPYFA